MNTVIFVVLFVLVLIAIVVLASAWEKRRSADIVRRWAEQNGFTIIESDFRALLKRGPFWASTWTYQAVRRVTVTGKDGKQKTGWVRCNVYWPTDKVEVRWD
ncbi:MAG: hypothetical protein V1929_06115 [bacterium]